MDRYTTPGLFLEPVLEKVEPLVHYLVGWRVSIIKLAFLQENRQTRIVEIHNLQT